MRRDHVFYGHLGGRDPTPEEIERHIRAAHRLRAEALHELLRGARERLLRVFRRSPATAVASKLQRC